MIPDGTEEHESTNINRSNLPSKGSRTNRRVINANRFELTAEINC